MNQQHLLNERALHHDTASVEKGGRTTASLTNGDDGS